ncbi:hypothetical protein RhiirA5_437193, partial [Rhizophagus irregularis]
MADCLRLGMVIPFILNRSLTTNCLKSLELSKLQERTAFKISLTNNDYEELKNNLKKERELLTWLFSDFVSLPNLHACYHLFQHARTFGTLTNTEVGVKEMVH